MKNSRYLSLLNCYAFSGLNHQIFSRGSALLTGALVAATLVIAANSAQAGFSSTLQGQSAGNTNWSGGPINGWKELDFVPCRTLLTGGPASNQVVTVTFDHTKGTTRGIQDLFFFSPSAGVTIVSGPTLEAPVGQDTWDYTFTVNLSTSTGEVDFFARLGSGCHLFAGASMHMGSPVMQISKPGVNPGTPNLAVVKSGEANAAPNELITYTVNYQNLPSAATSATGVQFSDMLPAQLTYISTISGPPPTISGNTLTWDLGVLAPGAAGSVSYQARVTNNAALGTTFQNFAQILSSETETDYSDNSSVVTTTVAFETRPTVQNDSYTNLEDTVLNVPAPGVLANDTDPTNAALTAVLVSGPSHGSLSFTNDGSFSYVPDSDYNGTDTFTYRAINATTNSTLATVTITVLPVNDAPNFTVGANQRVEQNSGFQTVVNWTSDMNPGAANETNQTLTFVVSNDNNALFSVQPSIDPSGTLTYAPAPNTIGQATVSVYLQDNGGTENGGVDRSVTKTFVITVFVANQPPSFQLSTNSVTVLEDAGPQSFAGFATNISAGPPSEADQTVELIIIQNTNRALFATGPAISPDGTLTFTTVPNANGSALLVVVIQDNGGGNNTSPPQTFTINVTPVNDAPSFTKGADQTVDENSGSHTVTNWATGISPGPPDEAGQALNFVVSSDNPSVFSTQPAVSPDGTLTYTVAPNANGTAMVSVYLHDDGGTANGGVDTSPTVTFSIAVNAVNSPPTFDLSTNAVTVLEDAGPQSVPDFATNITAGAVDEAGQTLTFLVVSNSNPGLFAAGPVLSTNGTLTFTSATDANGSADITVVLQDNGGGTDTSSPTTFTINVTPVNDAPSFTKGPDQSANESSGPQTIANWATSISPGPANESDQEVHFVVSNDNNGLFSDQPAISPTGTLTFTTAPDANGTATVTVYLQDNGGTANGGVDTSASVTFTITVNAVNNPPTFTLSTNSVTVFEDAGPQTVTDFATNILAGPIDEAGQTLVFIVVSNSNPALFASGPDLSTNGTLTFTTVTDANGSADITIVLQDNGGGNNTSAPTNFTINVIPVNDAPSFTKGSDQTVDENSGPHVVPNWATNISPGPANESDQLVNFIVSNDNPSLFIGPPAITQNGTLVFIPGPDAIGSATVTVTLHDNGGTDNGGVDLSDPQTFTITINNTNHPPTFVIGPDQTINEDDGEQIIPSWIVGMDAGTPSFVVTNDNNSLFSVQPGVSPTGTLFYTPADNSNGVAIVTVILLDGPTNASAPQTFRITVNPVNDAPTFTAGPSLFTTNDTGAQTIIHWATNIVAGPPNEADQTVNFIVSNNSNSLFTAQPSISSDGTLTFTPAAGQQGSATVSVVLHDNGGTDNGGVDSSPTNLFSITVEPPPNQPPSVTITNPLPGTVFVAPAFIPINVIATDADGTIARVEFFQGTNKLAETTNAAPYFFLWTNVPQGDYVLTAVATDNVGATGTSAPVNITVTNTVVTNQVPITTNNISFSFQTGLWHQNVTLTNNTDNTLSAVRISILSVNPLGAYVYNTNGLADGLPFIQYNQIVPPHTAATVLVQIYGVGTNKPVATYSASAVSQAPPPTLTGTTGPEIGGQGFLPDGTFLIHFQTEAHKIYFIQYNDTLGSTNWKTSPLFVTGNGGPAQWLDFGPAATESLPNREGNRFYKVIENSSK